MENLPNLMKGVNYLFCTKKERYKGELKKIENLGDDCVRLQFKHLKMEKECFTRTERGKVLFDKFLKVKQRVFDLSEITYIKPESEYLDNRTSEFQENLFS